MYSKISSVLGSAMVTRYVNVNVAKWISVILISLIFIFNVLNYMDSGRDPCRGILKAGTLMDKEEAIWQPHGCMLHSYRTSEAQLCIKNKKIAFLGDSRHRELMFSFVHLLFPSHTLPTEKVHSDIHINNEDHKISLNFYWVPELNDTLRKIYQKWLDNEAESPSIVFQGAGVHTLKIHNGSHDAVIEYAKNFTSFLPMLEQLTKERQTKIFWIYQESVEESLLGASRKMITNEKLKLYNEAIRDIASSDSSKIGITYIDVFRELSSKVIDLSKDGLHIPEKALHTCTNLLLNYFCNGKMKPIDGTCCQPAPPVTSVQVLVMIVLFLCILSAGALQITSYLQSRSKFEDVESGESKENLIENNVSGNSDEKKPVVDEKKSQIDTLLKLFLPLARYSVILFYFYFCDRTNIFMKANKHFTNARFFIPLLYISFLGLFGIIQTSQTALLNRDQTDEWKGWMQLIILIYHMSGASVNVPIYIHIRILVAMYLFMTGYGHFSYFWHKGDYSLYRVFNVLFRINFLTVSLCLIMDRPYQFYYFVPLCSFWFLVLYLTMSMWPRAHVKMLQADNNSSETTPNGSEKRYPFSHLNLTSPYALMTLKLILLFSAINLLFMSESYFEAIFSWWPAVRIFEFPAGSVREWWFRCQLDRFAMLFGAIFCFLYIILKKLSILDDSRQGCLISVKSSFISMSISIGIIITFVVWAAQCTDKVLCNRIHSYASIFPIAAFVIIRNVPGYLRSGYSAFFAWFGKISLELFIGQYHIWLAADTKGMLVLVSPEWPTLNLVVTTFIFVCVAHEINCVTGVIAKYLVGSPQDARIIGLQKVAVCISVICLISLLQQTFD